MKIAALFTLSLTIAVAAVAQDTAPVIDHDPSRCFEVGSFPRLCALVTADGSLGQARAYFRASGTTKWYYVDLADDDWRAIEITPRGWSVASCPPVRFVRPRGLRPLPAPRAGGTLGDLERFLNVRTEGDLKLVLGWLVMAFNPRGPYPILVLNGEQGSAKSTAARLLRSIVDPSQAPLRSPPREERDLLVADRKSTRLNSSH